MTPTPLVLAGAGGFARETVGLVEAVNERRPTWDLLGFVDDLESLHGTLVDGTPVLGPMDWVCGRDVRVAVCTGSPSNYTSRSRIVQRLDLPDDQFATLIHPTAVIAGSVTVGSGTVVHALTVATGHASIGAHVAVMPSVVITHDDAIGDFVTIAAGVLLAGNVRIGTGAYLGSGVRVREQRTIGPWSLVGMGSVVTHDIPAGEVWIGSPARFLRPSDQHTDDLDVPSTTSEYGAES